jgi:SAM-dependent methyltransferase
MHEGTAGEPNASHDVHQQVIDRYTSDAGRSYHEAVNAADDRTHLTLAAIRAEKLQPFISLDDDVLEFGAGLGVNLLALTCRTRTAYDTSDAGAVVLAPRGIRLVTDRRELDGEEFSVVICHHVLEHVPDPLGALADIRSLLQPGGRLVLVVPFETLRR